MKKGAANPLYLLLVIMGILAMPAGCDDQVGGVQHPADVRCEVAKVWAGPGGASPLPQLKDCGSGITNNWHNLPAGGWVTTDDSGEAWIDIDGCLIVYLFAHNGELRKSACPASSGAVVCSISGTSVYNNQCSSEIIIQTPSAQLVLEGTWLSVTYLPEMQVTLIIVLQGAVDVRPVLDFEEYTLDDTVRVEEGAFVYTMAGAVSPEIAEVPARTPLPLQELPLLVEPLDIQHWMDDVGLWAKEDNVLPHNWPFDVGTRAVGVSLVSRGGPLEDPRAQEAVLSAINKNEVSELAFPGQDVPFTASLGGQEVDAYTIPHNPDLAPRLLDKAGYPEGFGLQLVYPSEDEQLGTMADEMAADLEGIAIDVEMVPVAEAEMDEVVATMIAAGQPVLWLSRQ